MLSVLHLPFHLSLTQSPSLQADGQHCRGGAAAAGRFFSPETLQLMELPVCRLSAGVPSAVAVLSTRALHPAARRVLPPRLGESLPQQRLCRRAGSAGFLVVCNPRPRQRALSYGAQRCSERVCHPRHVLRVAFTAAGLRELPFRDALFDAQSYLPLFSNSKCLPASVKRSP